MNAPSKDIAGILAATSSVALTAGTDLFTNIMPETPDACVSVYDSGGDPPEPSFTYKYPTVQVRIRGDKGDQSPAYAQAEACQDALNGTENYTINSTRYIGIWGVGDIMFIGYDDNNRPIFTVNFRIHRTPA